MAELVFAARTLRPLGGAGTELAEISLFGASLGGVSLCLRLLRWGRGFSFGCVIALRIVLKKSLKGPPSATSVAVIAVKIDNERTIVRSDRFTRIISCQPLAMRVLCFAKLQLQPSLLRLSAIISQYFTAAICPCAAPCGFGLCFQFPQMCEICPRVTTIRQRCSRAVDSRKSRAHK